MVIVVLYMLLDLGSIIGSQAHKNNNNNNKNSLTNILPHQSTFWYGAFMCK